MPSHTVKERKKKGITRAKSGQIKRKRKSKGSSHMKGATFQ